MIGTPGRRSTVRSRCATVAALLCAWVLWEETESSRGMGKDVSWRALDAAEARGDCQTLLRQRLDEVAARPSREGWRRTRTAREFIEVSPEGTLSLQVRLTCLPNGTDPRPPVPRS
jgi:hypothetical protein